MIGEFGSFRQFERDQKYSGSGILPPSPRSDDFCLLRALALAQAHAGATAVLVDKFEARGERFKLLGCFFSCPALPLSVALWLILPNAKSLQPATEDPFGAAANRRPYAKTPRTPAFGMAGLAASLKDVQVGGGYLSLLHILY